MINPAKTLWWETYELWDAVLYRIGDVYYKVKPPKARPTSSSSHRHTTGPRRSRREMRERRALGY